MQTTLLGLAIAFIIALMAALIGPHFVDWNQFRPQFEAEATRVVGAPVRVAGEFDARLLPTPSLRLRSVVVGGANDLGKVRADRLDVEFSLGSLMRGEWRANELTIDGVSLDLGLDPQGRIDWPASSNGKFNLGTLAIDRLNLTGRLALHDAASRATLELSEIVFNGDVRALAGSVRGDGSFTLAGARYPFRVSSGQSTDGAGTRIHLNIDPAASAVSAELDGVLAFEARAPRFDGSMVLAVPAGLKAVGGIPITPWRISAKVKADPASAKFDQLEASYGAEERALKVAGLGDMRFGATPLFHAALSARQLDLDRFASRDGATEPPPLLPSLRALVAGIPQTPLPAQLQLNFEQMILGGRPLEDFAADLHTDAKSFAIDRLDFRAPGATRVMLSGANARSDSSNGVIGALDVESSDPGALTAWLLGRSDIALRNQKPLRLRGDVSLTANRVAIDAMKAETDGGTVEGRLAFSRPPAGASRFEAELKAERLDLDAASAVMQAMAGRQADWPDEAQLSLNIDRAISAGQEVRPFLAKLGYGPKTIFLDQLKAGEAGGVTIEGNGAFNRADATGRLALSANAASLTQMTGLMAPLVPALASRLASLGAAPGPARLKLALGLDRNLSRGDRADARAVLDFEAPQLRGAATLTANPEIAALRGIDLAALGRSEIAIESQLSSERGAALLGLLGLERMIAVGEGPAQFAASVTGMWRAPLRLNVKMSGAGLDAEAEGTAEPWAQEAKASVSLKARRVNFAPLLDLKPSEPSAQNISLSSLLSLSGNRLSFEDVDSAIFGTRLRGRIALNLDDQRNVEGQLGLDTLDLAPAFAFLIGAAGHAAVEPLGGGLLQGWRGRVAFEALRGALPGGAELRPFSGAVKSDGQSLAFEMLKGGIGGGEANADIDAKQGSNGIAVHARVQLKDVDGAALRYRGLAMPSGRTSMEATLESQGRSAAALTGALSGSGTVTLESVRIAGLDPGAFEAAIRASDSGQATDETRLRRIVEPILSAGSLPVASAQIPFNIRDGRLRVGASTLDSADARAIISGGYDIPADQADIRAIIASTAMGTATSRPEIQLFAAGSPDRLERTVDIATLSSWLTVRAVDRETRRLDSIERGDPPAVPASIPPAATGTLGIVPSGQPTSENPLSGRDSRRTPARPKAGAPRPPGPNAPVVTQQAAPLPPAIEVRPAPGVVRPAKPRQPLVLTPPVAN